MKPQIAALVLVFLLVPGSQAQTLQETLFGEDQEGETVRYQIRDITNTTEGGFTSEFDFLKLHTSEVAPGGSILRVNVQATFTIVLSSDGQWLYQLLVDGEVVDDCRFTLTTVNPGGFLAGDLPVYPAYDVECTIPPTGSATWEEGQSIPVEWRRTVASGVPDAPADSVVSIIIDREDFILTHSPTNFEQLTGVTGLEFLLFLTVIAFAVFFWSRSKDEIVQLFSSVLLIFFAAIAVSLYQAWSVWIGFGAVLGILGAYMLVRSAIEWYQEG